MAIVFRLVTRGRGLAALALASLLPGCASPPAPELKAALAAGSPPARASAYRVAVAPLEVAPAAALRPADPEDTSSPVPIDLPRLRADLTEAALASGAFDPARVEFLEALAEHERLPAEARGAVAGAAEGGRGDAAAPSSGDDEEARPGTPAFRVPAPCPPEKVLQAAFERRADLVLTFRVRKHAVRYVERNGWFGFNIVLYGIFVWPAWFVADEVYAAEMEVEAELRAVGSEKVLWSKVYGPGGETVTKDLDHFDRGWKLFGNITVPGSLALENYAAAGEVVLPHARNEIALALSKDLSALRADMDRGPFQAGLAHTLAVCAGVGRYKRIPEPRVATDDAAGIADVLRTRAGTPARNVVLLTESEPTKERVLAAVKERAGRGGPRDTLFFYFSGYGFEAGGELYLAPHDIDPQRPTTTAISLAELDRALAGARARQVVILDTSFGGESGRLRTLKRDLLTGLASGPGAAPRGEAAAQAALDAFARGRVVLVGTAPGAPASEESPVPEDKRGLFTARLMDAAASPATDRDRDGVVTVAEAFEVAQKETTRLSARAGSTQVPALLAGPGADARAAAIARVPKR